MAAGPDVCDQLSARLSLTGGARVSAGRGVALTHSDMRAQNTFQNAEEVRPAPLPVNISNESIVVVIPKQAVAAIEVQVA